MNAQDLDALFMLRSAVPFYKARGWWDAGDLLEHHLSDTGTDHPVDPSRMLQDIPTFRRDVEQVVAAHAGQPSWQTNWTNTNTDDTSTDVPLTGTYRGQQSHNWYYALHDFRYRVYGGTDPGTGQTTYSVEVYKPYVFGSPRIDITLPGVGKYLPKVPQDMLQHLHTSGLAADFVAHGTATFTR